MASRLRVTLPFILALAACAPGPGASQSASPSAAASVQASAAQQPTQTPPPSTTYPLTLTDDAGREVTLAADPEQIISLAPSSTEIVCALDACDQLVGVTDFDDYPAEVADIEHVVIVAEVDVEKVVAAEPDLVLAAGNELTPTAVIDQLTDLGLTVVTLYPESLDEIYAEISLVGELIDEQAGAAELVADMQGRVEAIQQAVAGADRPRTFYEVGVFQGVIYTAGADSFLASLIEIAGGDPITGDAVTTAIDLESLVVADPELILLGDAAYDATITPESVAARDGWDGMTAVVEGRVVVMLEDIVITRPGPRIVDGLEALAAAIHPEGPAY